MKTMYYLLATCLIIANLTSMQKPSSLSAEYLAKNSKKKITTSHPDGVEYVQLAPSKRCETITNIK